MTRKSEFVECHTDLGLTEELKDKDFRDQFFRTERELDIPAQLKGLRKQRGLSQGELAETIGTKQSAISRLENSSHGRWNLDFLVKISEALDARLAVVIEPYEAVIARYLAEQRLAGKSATTADAIIQPRGSSLLEQNDNRNPYQQIDAGMSISDRKSGAVWN